MVIIGWRNRVKILATIPFVCNNCSAQCTHQIFRRRKFFTVFLIPLFPVGAPEYRSSCGSCAARAFLTKEDIELLINGPEHEAARLIEQLNATNGIR